MLVPVPIPVDVPVPDAEVLPKDAPDAADRPDTEAPDSPDTPDKGVLPNDPEAARTERLVEEIGGPVMIRPFPPPPPPPLFVLDTPVAPVTPLLLLLLLLPLIPTPTLTSGEMSSRVMVMGEEVEDRCWWCC